jgi:hypothetical protein
MCGASRFWQRRRRASAAWDQVARQEFSGAVVGARRLNPDPSHETKAQGSGLPAAGRHPEIQKRASRWRGRARHPPDFDPAPQARVLPA